MKLFLTLIVLSLTWGLIGCSHEPSASEQVAKAKIEHAKTVCEVETAAADRTYLEMLQPPQGFETDEAIARRKALDPEWPAKTHSSRLRQCITEKEAQ